MAGWGREKKEKEGRRGIGQKRHIRHTCTHINDTEESKVDLGHRVVLLTHYKHNRHMENLIMDVFSEAHG